MSKSKRTQRETSARPKLPEEAPALSPEPSLAIQPAPEEIGPRSSFPIVGIGASAGGLAAIESFLAAMPAGEESNIAFVVVQHLSPDHKSILSELLRRCTRMQVFEATDGMDVEPNCAYIIPPNRDLALLNGKLQLLEFAPGRGARYPIDFFFRSLAAEQHERAICIVLSGTGSDGGLGVRAVKGEGGMAMAQTPETTEFDGMPRNAIATGLVDYILPPAEMPAQLISYVHRIVAKSHDPAPDLSSQSDDIHAKICVLLRARTSHDFSQYKRNTINRRVLRRMALQQIELPADYLRYLQNNPDEVSALFRDLLIGVTCFFRDPEVFSFLSSTAIHRLFEDVPPGGTIRVWVCGCSTGEEAYSISILIHEHLELIKQHYKVQIFATDIDRSATDVARSGVFPASIVADVSPERLSKFFVREVNGSFRIQKVIRDSLIFSVQDVIKDPPFSKVRLISCRNLLIYLNADLQKRLIPLFHYALQPGGMLLLGTSETIGDQPWLFEFIDRKAKIYLRKSDPIRQPLGDSYPGVAFERIPTRAPRDAQADVKLNLREIAERTLLRHLTPAAVLVDARGEVVYFHGRTGNYLEPAPGDAGSSLLAMAREGLRQELTFTLHRAVTKNEPVYANDLKVKTNGHFVSVNLTIVPTVSTTRPAPELFLVIFDEKPIPPARQKGIATLPASGARITALDRELRAKDEYIQTIIEEMETSGEELKSSNEEMQSINEELQSTNEELETSKEELQSVNEELATVNAELQQKVADLSRATLDMNNLLAGTGVGTLFVDNQLRITHFTPAVTEAINLIQSDVGRPLAHVVSNLVGYDRLVADVQAVLASLAPIEIEAQTTSGNWFILSIRPFKMLNNVSVGAVITFVDITQRKLSAQKLREAERLSRAVEIETVGIVFFRVHGAITSANNAFLNMVGYTREELAAGKISWQTIIASEWLPFTGAGPRKKQYIRKDGSRGWALFAASIIGEGEAVAYLISTTEHRSELDM